MTKPSPVLAFITFMTNLLVIPVIAHGADLTLQNGSVSTPCNFSAIYSWNPVNPPETVQFPGTSGLPPRWKATTDTQNAGGNINVSTKITHDDGMGCGGANTVSIDLNLTAVKPAGRRQVKSEITMGEVQHGINYDLGYLKTTVQTDNAGMPKNSTILVAGKHEQNPPIVASFTNDSSETIKTLMITPDYNVINDNNLAVKNVLGPAFQANKSNISSGQSLNNIPVPAEPPGLQPPFFNLGLASLKIVGSGSPATETDLAFLGLFNGVPGELTLGAALDMLLGDKEFFVPFLRPVNDAATLPLFVGIDLTQWVGLDGGFTPGETFSLTNGVSDALPGVLVGTSPIALGLDGYETGTPFTGDVVATGTIDGGTVPEPSSWALVLTGFIGLGSLRQRRWLAVVGSCRKTCQGLCHRAVAGSGVHGSDACCYPATSRPTQSSSVRFPPEADVWSSRCDVPRDDQLVTRTTEPRHDKL